MKNTTKPTHKPRSRLPPRGYDERRAADPVFTRLCRDVLLAHDARRRIIKGELHKPIWKADRLERESLKYLAAYLSAAAWASSDEDSGVE
jgi:hypothetical protein